MAQLIAAPRPPASPSPAGAILALSGSTMEVAMSDFVGALVDAMRRKDPEGMRAVYAPHARPVTMSHRIFCTGAREGGADLAQAPAGVPS